MQNRVTGSLLCGNVIFVDGNSEFSPATHFGKQVRKARLAHGWSIHQLADKTGINAGHLSRIENGTRRPTEKVAMAMDQVFPERQGWFTDYYKDSRGWKPGYRSWMQHERGARQIRAWSPGVLHGYVQTADYARAWLVTEPGAPPEMIEGWTSARIERQEHILRRENPPSVALVVDELSLYRLVESAEVMAAQMDHMIEIAGLPDVTMQVLPANAHPANASELIVADDAAYTEHLAGAAMHTDGETVGRLGRLFNTIQAESLRASQSIEMFRRMRDIWARGENPLTATVVEDRASR